jgi:predicted ATP-grasp superfamily ATP-dependent carboligase
MAEVSVVESVKIKEKNYTAVLGFAGAGFIGNTALMFVTRSKGFKQVGHVKSIHMPPMTLIVGGRATQSFRVYADEQSGLLYLITENLIPAEGCHAISGSLVQWLRKKGVKRVLSIEGLPLGGVSSEIKALEFSTDPAEASLIGAPPIREGAISGLNAGMLEECIEQKIPWTTIFIPTSKLMSVDHAASAEAVEVLNRMFKLGVDPSPLRSVEAQRPAGQKQRSGLSRLLKR